MKKNLLTALMISVITAAMLTGCGQAKESKESTVEAVTVEENSEEVEASESNNVYAEAVDESLNEEAEAESVEEEAETKDIPLDVEALVLPGESGFTVEEKYKSTEEYNGDIYNPYYVKKILFDGKKHYEELLDQNQTMMQTGDIYFNDMENDIGGYYNPEEGKWYSYGSTYSSYSEIDESSDFRFNNLRENEWEYVGEEDGMLLYTSKNGKSVKEYYNTEDSQNEYYDVEQTIYINPENMELIKLVESSTHKLTLSSDDDYALQKIDVEFVISGIGTTTVETPDGL